MLDDLWNDDARGKGEPELLRCRSHLLGADLAGTNFCGGFEGLPRTRQLPREGSRAT